MYTLETIIYTSVNFNYKSNDHSFSFTLFLSYYAFFIVFTLSFILVLNSKNFMKRVVSPGPFWLIASLDKELTCFKVM